MIYLLYRVLGASFGVALLTAIETAMIVNFAINNATTYRDQRRHGWGFFKGLSLFILACSLGSLSNYAVAQSLLDRGVWWPLAGICGLALGSVWNFAVSSVLSWRVEGEIEFWRDVRASARSDPGRDIRAYELSRGRAVRNYGVNFTI